MTDLYDGEDPDSALLDEPGDDDEYEYVRLPSESPRRRKVLLTLLGIAVVFAIAAGVGAVWLQGQINPSGPPGATVVIDIPTGSTTAHIGELLTEKGIIKNATVWKYYVKQQGAGPFQAGTFTFHENSSMGAAIKVLQAGPQAPPFLTFTVPEGFTITEIVARMSDPKRGIARFKADRLTELLATGKVPSTYKPPTQPSYEGLLFPDTYRVEDGEDELTVLTRMIGKGEAVMQAANVETAQQRLGLTPYEVMVVASLIEAEAKVPEDKPKIARVIYNRLKNKIPLGIDATSRYEAVLAGRDRDKVDFDSASPYNTRKFAGLPPTPIAAPGKSSIEAALNPADGPWIYYVLQDAQGHHFFTDSAREFVNAKAECKRKGLGCG